MKRESTIARLNRPRLAPSMPLTAAWGLCIAIAFTFTAGAQAQQAEETPPLEIPAPDLLEGIEEPPAEEPPPAVEEPPAEPLNTAEAIASQMQRVESRLRDADSSAETQVMQEEIIAALDSIIDQLKKSGAGQSSNSQPTAGQPSSGDPQGSQQEPESSQEQAGDDTSGEQEGEQTGEEQERNPEEAIDESIERAGHELGEAPSLLESRPSLLRQAWGHLPGHAAEAMPNAATEQFLPQYQREIEQYFRRLNEEQPSDSL